LSLTVVAEAGAGNDAADSASSAAHTPSCTPRMRAAWRSDVLAGSGGLTALKDERRGLALAMSRINGA